MTHDADFSQGAAVVIGGTGGFGMAITRLLARRGTDVVFTYHSAADKAQALVAEVAALGRTAVAVQLNLPDQDALSRMLEQAAKQFGGIHTVVHAYGPVIPLKFLSKTSVSEVGHVLEVETLGFYGLVSLALPYLRSSRGSLVAVLSAGLGRWPVKDGLSVIPKAAIAAILSGIAREEGRNGVRANGVSPGVMEAGMFYKLQQAGDIDQRYIDATRQMIPLQRLGSAEDVAEAVVFLASERARYVTGHVMPVDGGFSV